MTESTRSLSAEGPSSAPAIPAVWTPAPWVRRMGAAVKPILAIMVSAALGVAAFFIPWAELAEAVLAAHPLWLLIAVLGNVAAFPLWIVQWQILARDEAEVPFSRMFEVVSLGALAASALASAAGLFSSVALLVTRARMTIISASSLVVVDQLLVGLTKLLVLCLALALAPLPLPIAQGAMVLAGLSLFLLAGLLVLAHLEAPISRLPAPSGSLREALREAARALAHSLGVFRDPAAAALVMALAIGKKLIEIASAIAVQMACGIEPSLASAVLVVAAVGLATAVPVVPGGYGVYTASVFLVYEFLGVPAANALAAGLLQHLAEVIPTLAIGYAGLFTSRLADGRQAEAARA